MPIDFNEALTLEQFKEKYADYEYTKEDVDKALAAYEQGKIPESILRYVLNCWLSDFNHYLITI